MRGRKLVLTSCAAFLAFAASFAAFADSAPQGGTASPQGGGTGGGAPAGPAGGVDVIGTFPNALRVVSATSGSGFFADVAASGSNGTTWSGFVKINGGTGTGPWFGIGATAPAGREALRVQPVLNGAYAARFEGPVVIGDANGGLGINGGVPSDPHFIYIGNAPSGGNYGGFAVNGTVVFEALPSTTAWTDAVNTGWWVPGSTGGDRLILATSGKANLARVLIDATNTSISDNVTADNVPAPIAVLDVANSTSGTTAIATRGDAPAYLCGARGPSAFPVGLRVGAAAEIDSSCRAATWLEQGYARLDGAGTSNTILTYNVGSSDESLVVSANVFVTTFNAGTLTMHCRFTDPNGDSETFSLTESDSNGILATVIAGTGAFAGLPLRIRAKASTTVSITADTSAAWDASPGTYNAEAGVQRVR